MELSSVYFSFNDLPGPAGIQVCIFIGPVIGLAFTLSPPVLPQPEAEKGGAA